MFMLLTNESWLVLLSLYQDVYFDFSFYVSVLQDYKLEWPPYRPYHTNISHVKNLAKHNGYENLCILYYIIIVWCLLSLLDLWLSQKCPCCWHITQPTITFFFFLEYWILLICSFKQETIGWLNLGQIRSMN